MKRADRNSRQYFTDQIVTVGRLLRKFVGFFQAQYQLSQRRSCRLAGLSRKAMRYLPVDRGDKALSKALESLAEQYPRYGYLMLHAILRRDGLVQNKKRAYRLYTELGMQVRTKRRKKLIRPRAPPLRSQHPDTSNQDRLF